MLGYEMSLPHTDIALSCGNVIALSGIGSTEYSLPVWAQGNLSSVSLEDKKMERDENGIPRVREHLGDGVYAEFDGVGVWLRAYSPVSNKEVYLEPSVLNALNLFVKKCKQQVIAEDECTCPVGHHVCGKAN